jgi:putative sigma-54 modulation protein
MMSRLNLHGRNIELTTGIKDALFEKTERIFAHFDFIQSLDVHLSVQKNPRIADAHIAEALVHVNGGLVKVEAHSGDLYASIDALMDKLTRSLTKYKAKNLGRQKSSRSQGGTSLRIPQDALYAVPEPTELEPFYIELEVNENEAAAFAEAELETKRYA